LRDSQEKLQISHQTLRRLAAHADRIKERERKRIAREIHDDLGQNLLALRIEADMLSSRTGSRHPHLHSRALSTVAQIDATIRSVRQIINDLRPNVLDLGLSAAVEWQIIEFRRRAGIACDLVQEQSDIRIEDHSATALFRILQESLSNVVRHAHASYVRVTLRLEAGTLRMIVWDNGIGLPPGGRAKLGSFGLIGIEERIHLLGGIFSLNSTPGNGTTISVAVPVASESASSSGLAAAPTDPSPTLA
jgi:signal transduction histidine kinase